MDLASAIPLGALVISVTTLVILVWTNKHKADETYVLKLERRVVALEKELRECMAVREELRREKYELLERWARRSDAP